MANDTPISDREREILRLVATGASNQQIAQQLSISINTVKVHLRNIFSKIGVVSRTEATIYAINNGLVAVERALASSATLQPREVDQESPERVEVPVVPRATEQDGPALPAPVPRATEQDGPALPAPVPRATEQDEPALLTPLIAAPPRATSIQRPKVLLGIGAAVVLLLLTALGVQVAGRAAAPAPTPVPTPAPTAGAITAVARDADQRWFTHTPMPNPRDGFALVAYDQERKLYVIGGTADGRPSAAIDRFDPESDLWVSLTDKPTAVSDAGAISLYGNIYVPGGIDADGNVRDILEIFDPREQRWRVGAPMPTSRSRYALIAWEGRLYVIGGWDGAQVCSEVYIYDPQNDSWVEGHQLVSPRQNAGAAMASGRLYVVGGNDGNAPLRESLYLDPSARDGRWEAIAPLPIPVMAPGVVAPIGILIAFDSDQHQGFQYDRASDSWKIFSIPEEASISSYITLLEPNIYFVSNDSARIPGRVDEYRVIYTVFIPSSGGGVTMP